MQHDREEHVFRMAELRETAALKDREARIRLAEKGLAARQGPDGGEEFMSADHAVVLQSQATMKAMQDQQAALLAQMAQQNSQAMATVASALAQLGDGMRQLGAAQQANAEAKMAPRYFEIERDEKTGRMVGAKVVR